MSLWARFIAWWEAGKAERQAIAARKQQARVEARLAGTPGLGGYGAYTTGYHGPSGSDCGPMVSDDCGGTPA
jgi:hypothetical protein